MTITFDVPRETPSANNFAYCHWRVRHADKQLWSTLLLYAIGGSANYRNWQATGKRKLLVERFGKRKLDPDNLIAGLKGIIDHLRALGLLVDDNDEYLELEARNCKRPPKTPPFTRFTLTDL